MAESPGGFVNAWFMPLSLLIPLVRRTNGVVGGSPGKQMANRFLGDAVAAGLGTTIGEPMES